MVVGGKEASQAISTRLVKVIYIPIANPTVFHLVGLAVGVLVSAILSTVLLGVPSFLIPIPLPDKVSAAIKIGLFVLAILVGPVIWTCAYNSMRHKRAMKPTKCRTDRLSKVFTHPSARERLPHRWIEYLLRESPRGNRKVAQFFASVRHGHCIVIAPRWGEIPLPQRRDLPFEPIEVSDAGVACSPELDPVVVRVSTAREPGKEAQDERQATHPGPDHRQAA